MIAPTSTPRPASAAEVLALLRERVRPLPGERVPLMEAAGRILRESVCAPEDQPPFDRSSMDGYAVRLDDPSMQFQIVDEIRAGDWKPRTLQPGDAVRIATGGGLPGDGLQVIMREDVEVRSGTLVVLRRDRELNIRARGEDASLGAVLVKEGSMLSPGTLALLASVGCTQPLVNRLPTVLHVATGNEIVAPDQKPKHGQIRDSNSTLVRAFLGQWSIEPEQLRVGEDEAAIQAILSNSLSPATRNELLLISGGASVGEHDFTLRVLQQTGFTIHVSKTTARPGKPLILAQRDNTIAFGLPGNPLSHFACLHLYVRAALEAFAGKSDGPASTFQTAVLEDDLLADGNARETFWPARWELQDGVASLTPLRWSSSGDLTSLATANALIRVSAGAPKLDRGARVEFIPTERIA